MALQKTTTLDSGVIVSYFRITALRWDRSTKEASAIFSAFKDADASQQGKAAVVPVFAKLRLENADFDAYLPPSIESPIAAIYSAAKAQDIICDFGPGYFVDAVDV
jgi:hypothetical protein